MTPRRGVTLVELLLVLVLLVVIGSLAAPTVDNAFVASRLRRGGDRVLAAWSQARIAAIDSGEVTQFTFQLSGDGFRVELWDPLAPQSGASPATSSPSAASVGSAAGATPPGATVAAAGAEKLKPIEGKLPEQITFHAGQIVSVQPEDRRREVASLAPQGGEWSQPILFFPDGSSSDAAVTLATDRKQYQRITLRGLTAVGRASLVMGATELQRHDATQPRTP
ncbi:MAG: prepilin-type N-terminal cleavage/methylation domain-containing protein [Pirellulales bacterium]|nr:prepilin-type N-terminal cleavage/methylation domain-containing protein [Pirellulales bacterium]